MLCTTTATKETSDYERRYWPDRGTAGTRRLPGAQGEREPVEACITVETTADVIGRHRCGVRALAKERRRVDVRDLPCFGCPARLVWLNVADPFHVMCAANRVVDKVCRRVQNETLGHRSRKHDPLYGSESCS